MRSYEVVMLLALLLSCIDPGPNEPHETGYTGDCEDRFGLEVNQSGWTPGTWTFELTDGERTVSCELEYPLPDEGDRIVCVDSEGIKLETGVTRVVGSPGTISFLDWFPQSLSIEVELDGEPYLSTTLKVTYTTLPNGCIEGTNALDVP